MRGYTHALSAAAAYAALGTYVWHQSLPVLVTGTAIAAGAGVLSDIDTRGSCVARSFGCLSGALAWIVHRVSGGHREGTHTGVGDVVCALLAVAAIALEGWSFRVHHAEVSVGRVILAAYLALLFGAAMKALRRPRRNHRRELLAVAAAVAMAWTGWDSGGIAWAILLGTATHAAGDACTKHGVPWLLPFSRHVFHLLPKGMRISTGHVTERAFIAPALLVIIGILAWRNTGVVHLAAHARTAIGAP